MTVPLPDRRSKADGLADSDGQAGTRSQALMDPEMKGQAC